MDRVGFLGLGIMGSRMAATLARAGHELVVWTHTDGKAAAWAQEHGAVAADTPAEVAASCATCLTMVVDGAQVREVVLGAEGLVAGTGEPRLVVDLSTIGPAAVREIAGDLPPGWALVDAPVTGSSPKAQDGTLAIMAGGDEDAVQRAWPLLAAMGELVVHVGPSGQGQTIKLINNAVSAANIATVAQALLAGDAAGADLDALVAVMAAGAGGSAALDLKAGPMRAHDYTTLFKLDHMLKDLRLCLEEAQRDGVPFPAAATARDALVAASSRGYGDADVCAVLEAFEGFAGRVL